MFQVGSNLENPIIPFRAGKNWDSSTIMAILN